MCKSISEIRRMFQGVETGLYYKDNQTPVKEGDFVTIDGESGTYRVVYMPRRACFGLQLIEVSDEGVIVNSSPSINALLNIIPTSLSITDPDINLNKIEFGYIGTK